MIGLQTFSNSFCWYAHISFSAMWFLLSHMMISLHLSKIIYLSLSMILPLIFFTLNSSFQVEGVGFKRTLRRHLVSLVFCSTLCFLTSWTVPLVSPFSMDTFHLWWKSCSFFLYCYPQTMIWAIPQKTVLWLWIKTS